MSLKESSPSAGPFDDLFSLPQFVDRFESDRERGVDVIIPIINTNVFWRSNLLSIYREIPVRRLLLGDGGSEDDSVEVAREFPRVEVLDHRDCRTLGFSLRELIRQVESEWFVYLHSDVWLPAGWFERMWDERKSYDWFECDRRKTVLLDFPDRNQNQDARPYSGSQMGRIAAFQQFIDEIDDDYLYRNEDLVFCELIKEHGGRYGRVHSIHHHHQVTNRPGDSEPDFEGFDLIRSENPDWRIRTSIMQIRGLIKYTQPGPRFIKIMIRVEINRLASYGALDPIELLRWTYNENRAWFPYIVAGILTHGNRFGVAGLKGLGIVREFGRMVRILFSGIRRRV